MFNISESVKLVKKSDFLILLALLAIAAVWIIIQNVSADNSRVVAVISHDGNIVQELELSNSRNGVFSVPQTQSLQYEVNDGSIRFVNSKCADHRCEQYGYLNRSGQLAVCLPNKTTINIKGDSKEIDMILNS